MYRLSHRNIGLLICCYRGSLILGIMHVYLTAHMREGISARPGVTGGVTGSGGTSNTPQSQSYPAGYFGIFPSPGISKLSHAPKPLSHSSSRGDIAMSNFQLPPGFRPSDPSSSSSQPGQNGQQQGDDPAARERAAAQEEMKRSMIAAMLEPAARERCELLRFPIFGLLSHDENSMMS